MKLLKLLQSVSELMLFFYMPDVPRMYYYLCVFFAITENLMTKRSFIFGIFHEQKEKKKIKEINILLSFSVFSSHA